MQILNINRYLLSIYVESVLKVYTVKVLIEIFIFSVKSV